MSGTAYFFTTKLQELNRIVIPPAIVAKLDLKKGDLVSGYIGKISETEGN